MTVLAKYTVFSGNDPTTMPQFKVVWTKTYILGIKQPVHKVRYYKNMRRIAGFVASVAAAWVVGSFTPAFANDRPKEQCSSIASGLQNVYLADTGDAKGAALYAENQNCGRDGDGDWRWMFLSKKYRALMNAASSGNADAIVNAAEALRKASRVSSSMYTSCWKTMLKHANTVGDVVEAGITTLSGAKCEK